MIKVLEHGILKVTCPKCKAKLQYEQEDIKIKDIIMDIMLDNCKETKEYLIYPDCGNEIILTPIKR